MYNCLVPKNWRIGEIMQIYEELVARGLIAQVTNEEEIKNMINEGKATFYIGFDPTADSPTDRRDCGIWDKRAS